MLLFIIIFVVIAIVFYIKLKPKKVKVGTVTMINGAVKTGKTLLAVRIAIKCHKKQLLKYRFKKYILRKNIECPLLYTNIKVKYKYACELTRDHIRRLARFNYGSVVLISEMSLVANSQSWKGDEILNEEIESFVKLFGHETCGGYLICETQSIADNHYAVKRCLSQYLYIHSTIKYIPFVVVMKVREMIYSDDNQSAVNVFNGDLEDSLKSVIISKKYFKYYDRYGYSVLTDDLPKENTLLPYSPNMNLKQDNIVSFRKFKSDAFKVRKDVRINDERKE